MKSINIYTLIACFYLVSCTFGEDQYSLIKNAIEEEILSKANDPSSYSFVEMEIADTLYYDEIAESVLSWAINQIEYYDEQLENNRDLYRELGLRELIEQYEANINDYEKEVSAINTFKEEHEAKLGEVAYFEILFSHRENNQMGALELFRKVYEVRLLPDNEVEIIWSADRDIVEELRNNTGSIDTDVWLELGEQVFSNNARSIVLKEMGIDL